MNDYINDSNGQQNEKSDDNLTASPEHIPTGNDLDPLKLDDFQKVIAERDEAKDQLLRVIADLQNFRRRAFQEKEELRKRATEQLVEELLPVLDNFERTFEAINQGADLKTLQEGLRMVDRQFRGVLEKVDVSRISSIGSAFDPDHHEAVGFLETDEHPDETVIEELSAGYKMGEKVIRPSKVRVSKKK